MPQRALRGRRPRTPVIPRSLASSVAGIIVAAAAVFAAPAAAQAAATAPAPTAVPCSSSALVTAIRNANRAGAATLQLARGCNYVLTRAVAEDDGLPLVTGNIVIIGGPGSQISHGRSAGLFRILEVSGGALTLVDLTVANGQLAGEDGFDDEGGGIRDAGTLVLRHVRLTGNSNRGGFGGGLYVDGGAHATISDSDLVGNSATGGSGGGVFSLGDLTVDQSVLAGNTAASGGGIFNLSPGTVTLRFTLVAFNSPDNCSPQGTIAGCRN